MATILNTYNCLTSGGNTGVSACPVDIGTIVGGILAPDTFAFTEAQLADSSSFLTALQAATLAVSTARAYPIKNLDQPNDASEANTYQTTAYGNRRKIRNGVYDKTYEIISGAMCLWLQIAKFSNRGGLSWFPIDENGLLQGMKVGNTLKGIPLMLLDAPAPKDNDGSNATAYYIKLVYKQDYLRSWGFIKLQPGAWDSVNGLQNVAIKSGTDTGVNDRTNGVSTLKVDFSCPGADFYDLYKTILGSGAAAATLWKASAPNGNDITVTSVVFNDNIRGYTATVDTSDPDYSSTAKVTWKLADPATLNAAGIIAVESNSYTTKN